MPVFLSECSPSLYGFFLDFSPLPLPLPLPLLFVMILVEERKTESGREHVVVESESERERERVWSLCARKVYFRGEYFDGGIGE